MVRDEHPEPLLGCDLWLSLNGRWGFAIDPDGTGVRQAWYHRDSLAGEIEVPFCVESSRSGVGKKPGLAWMWYVRSVEIPESWKGRTVYLNLGAVDYICRGYVNGQPVGVHEGGYTPMRWRIDPFLKPGTNFISLQVSETRDGALPRGKQTHLPFKYAVWYTPFSGVWQSVWLEARGAVAVQRVVGLTREDGGGFVFQVQLSDEARGVVQLSLTHPDGTPEVTTSVPVSGASLSVPVELSRAAWWTPETPNLYQVVCTLLVDGKVVDRVTSHAGLRTIAVRDGKVMLNGAPLYQKLLLYQAYYPGGWVTAEDDDVLRQDVENIKSMGFNGIRIHQTQADPRLLTWCDRLGLLVWDEIPSPFLLSSVNRGAFERHLRELIERDAGHPSVITWVLFNETWGIMDVLWRSESRDWLRQMVALCRELDPSRLVIDNSGYDHVETDILDLHHYHADPRKAEAFYQQMKDPASVKPALWRNVYMIMPGVFHKAPLAPGAEYHGEPLVVSELGGFGFAAYGGKGKSLEENLRLCLETLARQDHIQGFCYTQYCDVEQEANGLFTFERQPKLPVETVKALLEGLFSASSPSVPEGSSA